MRPMPPSVCCVLILLLASCGSDSATSAPAAASQAPVADAPLPPGIMEVASVAQFEAEIAKERPGVVVVADFHAEWCAPCKKLGADLSALALAHPGRLIVLRVDTDRQPELANRYQADIIPLLVRFAAGKESARMPGYYGKDKLATWLGLP